MKTESILFSRPYCSSRLFAGRPVARQPVHEDMDNMPSKRGLAAVKEVQHSNVENMIPHTVTKKRPTSASKERSAETSGRGVG